MTVYGKSCFTNLIFFAEMRFDEGSTVDIGYMLVSKVFDRVQHCILVWNV